MIDPLILISIIVLIFCLIGLSWFAGSDAPYIASDLNKVRSVLIKLRIKRGHIFYELGSGDGRVVIEAAKFGASAFGIEQSWIRTWYSRYKAWKEFHKNVDSLPKAKNKAIKASANISSRANNVVQNYNRGGCAYFCHGNIFKRSYEHANFVYIYLLQKAVDSLEGKLKKELKKGSIVITQTYHFKNWKPYRKIGNFYLYKLPRTENQRYSLF